MNAAWETGQTGKTGPYFSVLMVDHNVMRLHIAVHDALAVAEIQRLEELGNVEPNIEIVELRVQASEVGIVHELEDERWCFALYTLKVNNRTLFRFPERHLTMENSGAQGPGRVGVKGEGSRSSDL